jgi:hypothetical protein
MYKGVAKKVVTLFDNNDKEPSKGYPAMAEAGQVVNLSFNPLAVGSQLRTLILSTLSCPVVIDNCPP